MFLKQSSCFLHETGPGGLQLLQELGREARSHPGSGICCARVFRSPMLSLEASLRGPAPKLLTMQVDYVRGAAGRPSLY